MYLAGSPVTWQTCGMKAIPVVVRERILQLYDQGKSTREIAASFGYCVAAVRRVRQHFRARGTLEPQTHRCGRKTLLTESGKARLLELLAAVKLKGPKVPWMFDGPMDGELFLAWVKQGLVPVLQRNEVVVLDNLATH